MKKYIIALNLIFTTTYSASDTNQISDKAFIELKEFIRKNNGQPEQIAPKFWLHAACHADNLEAVKYLIESRTIKNINRKDGSWDTPLHIACYGNNLKLIRYLIDNGAEINNRTIDGLKPIDIAINNNNWPVVKLLIIRFPRLINSLDFEILLKSCEDKSAQIFFILINGPKFNNLSIEDQINLIFKACQCQNLKIVKYLLKNNANLIAEKNTLNNKYCLNYLNKTNINEILIYLEFYVCNLQKFELKPEYFGNNINNISVITFLLQQNININNGTIDELLDSRCSTASKSTTLEKFNFVKRQLTNIIQAGSIDEIKALNRITFFFSTMQIAKLIIEQINSDDYNENKVIELVKLLNPKSDFTYIQKMGAYLSPVPLDLFMIQQQSYDLAFVRDENGNNILYHALAKGLSRRELSLFLIYFCKDTIFNSIKFDNNYMCTELAIIYQKHIMQENKKVGYN